MVAAVWAGAYTIAEAVRDCLADRKRNEAKTADRMAYDFNARVPADQQIPQAISGQSFPAR